MRWRSTAGHTHPLAIPLLGALAAGAFGSLYWYFGVGGTLLHGAITFAILYGSIVAVVLGIAGIVWCAVKLLAIRGRFFTGRNEEMPGTTPVRGGATRFSE
jgi:hypothetical protein